MKTLLTACICMGLHLFATFVFAHGPDDGYPVGPWMMWWGHGMGWIFPLLIVVFIVVFLLMGRRGGRGSWCGSGQQEESETALDILNKRYAKGEIGKEEFERMKKDIAG